MAWFNLPLFKVGNRKCPNCGHAARWALHLFGTGKDWDCPKCHAGLRWDNVRKIPGVVIYVGMIAPILVFTSSGDLPIWAFFLVLLLGPPVLLWWFDSIVLRRAPEQAGGVS